MCFLLLLVTRHIFNKHELNKSYFMRRGACELRKGVFCVRKFALGLLLVFLLRIALNRDLEFNRCFMERFCMVMGKVKIGSRSTGDYP